MHDTDKTSMLHCCLLNPVEGNFGQAELETQWYTMEEINQKQDMVESDKLFLQRFYEKQDTNYLKLDCYRNEQGEYYWR